MTMKEKLKEADAYMTRALRAESGSNFNEAKMYYRKAALCYEELAESCRSMDILQRQARAYMGLSWMSQSARQAREAEKWGEKYLETSREMYELVPSPEMKHALAYAYQNMGDIGTMKQNMKDAEKYYLICHDMYQELIEETDSIEAYRDLATMANGIGHLARIRKDYKMSEKWINEGIETWVTVSAKTGQPQDLQKLAVACYNAALAAVERDDKDTAKNMYEKSADVYKMVAELTGHIYFMKQAESAYLAEGEL